MTRTCHETARFADGCCEIFPRTVSRALSLRGENALNQRTQILQRRVRLERARERCVRPEVVPRQPWQPRLGPAIPEPTQLEIVLQRLKEQLDPAVLRLQIAAGDAHQHLRQ